jgi:hypothetical protein
MGGSSDFERQIDGTRSAEAHVVKTALSGASRRTVSRVMSACTDHGKATQAKRNSRQKSAMTQRDILYYSMGLSTTPEVTRC